MTSIVPFDFETNAVRAVVQDGEPWFVAADVCRVLEHSNARVALKRWLDDDEKGVTICYTLGGQQEMSIISESGLYTLIVRSQTPAARRFRKWVTAEVLPALRKYGTYSLTDRQQLREKRIYYEGLPDDAQARAMDRHDAVETLNALISGGVRIGDALREVAADRGISPATVRCWRDKTYMVADADIPAALAPKWYGERALQGVEGYVANEVADYTQRLQALAELIVTAKQTYRRGH